MTAVAGYGLIYAVLTRGLDEDARLEVDDILGDPSAKVEIQRRRRAALAGAGAFE